MELRPFRCLRFSPAVLSERGLDALIAPPRGENPEAAPENIARITLANGTAAAETLARWLSERILMKERRPGLWIYRQTSAEEEQQAILSLLVGLVRVAGSKTVIEQPEEAPLPQAREERLAFRRETKADFEPCLLSTRAPLSGALATTRSPDLSATDARGVRHDAFRIGDFAQHVQLQGLVKNAQASLVSGSDLYEAARAFADDAAAAKLSGAKFKLCAIGEESALASAPRIPEMYSGLFAVSLEDPVY
jgi:uncharacterized protein (DUF1015 family)